MLIVAKPPGVHTLLVRQDSPILSIVDTRDMFVSRFSWEDARYLSFGNALLKNAYEAELFDDFEFPALKNEYIDYQSLDMPFIIGHETYSLTCRLKSIDTIGRVMQLCLNDTQILVYKLLIEYMPHTDLIYRYGGYIVMRVRLSMQGYLSLVFLPDKGLVSAITAGIWDSVVLSVKQRYRDTSDEAKLRMLGGLL